MEGAILICHPKFLRGHKKTLIFHMNPLLGSGFTGNIKPYLLRKIKVKH